MEHPASSTTAKAQIHRIPTVMWVIALGVIAALIAILVFKVAAGMVLAYGVLGLICLSHLFMRGDHAAPTSHGSGSQASEDTDHLQHGGHTGRGGCH